MSRIDWRGDQFLRQVEAGLQRNLSAAASHLVEEIKAQLSRPGALRRSATTKKKGKASPAVGAAGTATHSKPGDPPFMQSGRLRASIGWELTGPRGLTVRVGSGLAYARALETTRNRPFLRATLLKHRAAIAAILTRRI